MKKKYAKELLILAGKYFEVFTFLEVEFKDQIIKKNNKWVADLSLKEVRAFLLGHTLELILKSFLSNKGVKKELLKDKYRHDLIKIYRDSEKLGLNAFNLDRQKEIQARQTIEMFNKAYMKNVFRYYKQQTYWLPLPSYFKDNIVNPIYKKVKKIIG